MNYRILKNYVVPVVVGLAVIGNVGTAIAFTPDTSNTVKGTIVSEQFEKGILWGLFGDDYKLRIETDNGAKVLDNLQHGESRALDTLLNPYDKVEFRVILGVHGKMSDPRLYFRGLSDIVNINGKSYN